MLKQSEAANADVNGPWEACTKNREARSQTADVTTPFEIDKIVQEIRLLGQPPLHDHLDFIRHKVAGGSTRNQVDVVDRWRRANDRYYDLAEQEAGIADEIQTYDLAPDLDHLVVATKADFRYRNTFNKFPTCFSMVELDRLVVYQTHVVQQFAEGLRARLGPDPDPETLFRFCQPADVENAPVDIREIDHNRYIFSSESTDFRQHPPVLLQPDQVEDYETFGPLSGMVGLGVGFGSNFLTAIRVDDRLLLHNGYHRAYALRSAGVTHAPCIVQTVTRRDELEVAAKSVVADDPGFYFASPRPPLLKDFFDEQIAQHFSVYRTKKMIEVTFDIKSFEVRV